MTALDNLTPNALVRGFGTRAALTRDGVRVLHEALAHAPPVTLATWKTLFGKWAGRAVEKIPRHLAALAGRYGISAAADGPDTLLFALQTYYAMLVNLVASRLMRDHRSRLCEGADGDLLPGSPFSWYRASSSQAVQRLIERLDDALAGYRLASPASAADDGCDLFKPLYQDLFPRPLRRQLGEYYTPDWLAAHVLDQVGYAGQPGSRLLDPACGSGTFLVMALRRSRESRVESRESSVGAAVELPHQLVPLHSPLSTLDSRLSTPFPIVGFDVNPLAVITARANYLIAIADLLPTLGRVEIPVYLYDSILGEGELPCATEPFDYVVGNPPWIAWDNLPEEARQATKPLWEQYGLFSLSGNAARHGGGKKDLSMLMLYAAADRYLKPRGRLGMVITQTLFQTKGAGDGFRRFRLGPDGPPLKVLRVDDMVALRPFGEAANWTSTIVLQKGAATEYPVPYFRWKGEGGRGKGENDEARMTNDELPAVHHSCLAQPVDPARPNSPWLVMESNDEARMTNDELPAVCHSSFVIRHSQDYTAHLGANSGGANGVYWVDVLDAADSGVRIRNVTARGKHRLDTVEQAIESDLLDPLLRWSDVRRWSAVPRGHILLAQDPASRTGIAEATMRERYPHTLAYLERFRELLASRAAYRRYQGRSPFYSMYNVGPYTIAPIKVVWRRMDRQINAVVVEEVDDPWLGRRPVIPQETCVLVACDSADEAHYVCAVLNSAIVNERILASSVRGGKGFGTPGMLEFIPLRRFEPGNPLHAELATLSRQAHARAGEEIQRDIDRLAAKLLC